MPGPDPFFYYIHTYVYLSVVSFPHIKVGMLFGYRWTMLRSLLLFLYFIFILYTHNSPYYFFFLVSILYIINCYKKSFPRNIVHAIILVYSTVADSIIWTIELLRIYENLDRWRISHIKIEKFILYWSDLHLMLFVKENEL